MKAYANGVFLTSANEIAYMKAEHVDDGCAVTGSLGGRTAGDERVTCLLLHEGTAEAWMLAQFDSAAAADWWLAHTGKQAGWRAVLRLEDLSAGGAGGGAAASVGYGARGRGRRSRRGVP